jgi:hypothetical protein
MVVDAVDDPLVSGSLHPADEPSTLRPPSPGTAKACLLADDGEDFTDQEALLRHMTLDEVYRTQVLEAGEGKVDLV